jgi:hypothetical protein
VRKRLLGARYALHNLRRRDQKGPRDFLVRQATFAPWRGQEINDSSGRLEPGSRAMAGIKLRAVGDIDADLILEWLRRARALES